MAARCARKAKKSLPGLLDSTDGLAKRLETVLSPILQAQVSEALGAQRYERSDERAG